MPPSGGLRSDNPLSQSLQKAVPCTRAAAVETGETEGVLELTSPNVVFNIPVVFRPCHGPEALGVIFRAVKRIANDFHYERVIDEIP